MKGVTLRWWCTNSEASGSSESKECWKAALRTACLDPLHCSAVSWPSFLHYRNREVARTRRVLIKCTTVYRTEFPENVEGWAGGGGPQSPTKHILGRDPALSHKDPWQSITWAPAETEALPALTAPPSKSSPLRKNSEARWARVVEWTGSRRTRGKADQTYCLSRPQGLVLCLSKQ